MGDTEHAERLAAVSAEITALREKHDRLVSERDELIRTLREHGWTLERIAQHAGITAQAIHKRLKKETDPDD